MQVICQCFEKTVYLDYDRLQNQWTVSWESLPLFNDLPTNVANGLRISVGPENSSAAGVFQQRIGIFLDDPNY
jgi:hypothetical protein